MHGYGTQIVVVVGVMLFSLFGSPLGASAATTPDTCDADVKYYCVHIDYDPGSGVATVYNRWYEGAVDGGARQWQRLWATDYHGNGSYWETVRSWGEGNWYNDVYMGHWEALGGGTIAQPAIVMVRLRYQEYAGGSWYYRCSQQNEHRLFDNTSIRWGTGDCLSS